MKLEANKPKVKLHKLHKQTKKKMKWVMNLT